MHKRSHLLILVVMGTLLFHLSCEDNGVEKPTAGELINQGWLKFEARNLAGAGSDFGAALSISTGAGDSSGALLGLGWAKLRQGEAGLAEDSFLEYLNFDPELPGLNDGRAGLAFAYSAQEKFQGAIDAASAVISSDASWSFAHDNTISHLDLRLVLAQSYYAIADFSSSLEMVQYFDSSFNVDVNTPQGRRDLADKIESLWTG